MGHRTRFVAPILVFGVAAGVLLTMSDATDRGGPPFDSRDCTSGYVDGGVVDHGSTGSSDTPQRARARAESALLRPDLHPASSSLTFDGADRKVWTYYDRSGATLAEIDLERAGRGWRPAGAQQCARDGVAQIQAKS